MELCDTPTQHQHQGFYMKIPVPKKFLSRFFTDTKLLFSPLVAVPMLVASFVNLSWPLLLISCLFPVVGTVAAALAGRLTVEADKQLAGGAEQEIRKIKTRLSDLELSKGWAGKR